MLSFGHLVLVLLIVVLLFGAGKLPKVMGDIGKGVRNLRKELSGDEGDEKPLQPMQKTQEVLPPEKKGE